MKLLKPGWVHHDGENVFYLFVLCRV